MQLLEEHFDAAFNAPDGIRKLRELILTLGMQGKLVEQDPSDPPASELLKEIETKKRKLVESKKIKLPRKLPPIDISEVPFDLPPGWEWIRLGELGVINPRNNAEDDLDVGFVSMSMISSDIGVDHSFETRKWKDIKTGFTHIANGDIALAKITPCFENAKSCVFKNLPNGIGAGTTELHVFRNSFGAVEPLYLLNFLKNPKYIADAIPFMTGTAGQRRVPTEYFTQTLFPLPPLPEQRRIVTKIDQLMARCNEIEALRISREHKRQSVHGSALNALLSATEPETFAQAWGFLRAHFGDLHQTPKDIEELRQAVIQLAVMGKLVPQDPSDPPARILIDDINNERQRLISLGKIKSYKPLPNVSVEEMPFQIPQGWEWVRLNTITAISGGITKGRNLTNRKIVELPYLRVANVQRGYLVLSEMKNIELPVDEIEKYILRKGDLLITEGGDWDKVGRTAIWQGEIDTCVHQNHVFKARKILATQNELWLEKFLNSQFCRIYFAGASKQTTNLASINMTQLQNCPIALPPLLEQHRIISRLNHLISLCNKLDKVLKAQTSKQSEILNALMSTLIPSSVPSLQRAPIRSAKLPKAHDSLEGSALPQSEFESLHLESLSALPIKRRGRPAKKTSASLRPAIPSAANEAEAIRMLENMKLERALGTRQNSLFDLED
ncbi:restriction endonuclease subunit S [Deinococcus cellulosilyticus]|uniref:Type I restriction endonuclease EcoAI subunit S n=1 Tax=Deinococcus cellulosilyticus (strain DSM 18568 / NBRC 106333 / KACC 11606 / 5516J-15) TaxID=1223518 RepID=A0A511N715_DEIC1|nr:restriction endonuclease subunit S [Deinococcus cellulosilyticus]GEM48643.1 type I restriction endonuclease EcoAI subunit S [Deinococcus cellulosilyticus NBRC 106333 = KACC 11606]